MNWRVCWLLVASLAAACGTSDAGPVDTAATCSGGKCDSSGFEAQKGGIWTACHIEPGATEDLLRCRIYAEGELLAPVGVSVQGSRGGVIVASGITRLTGEDYPATIRHADYPIDLEVSVDFDHDHAIKGFSLLRHKVATRVSSAAAFPVDSPLVVEQPFDIWPVQIATTEQIFVFESEVDAGQGITLRPSLIGSPTELAVLHVAVPRDAAELAGTLRVGSNLTEVATTITGPGRYVATLQGLRAATDSDVALFGDAPEPTEPPVEPPATEPGCTFDYLGWLAGFRPLVGRPEGALHLDAIECKPVGAVEYQEWHDLFTATLAAGLPSSSSTLDASETAALQMVLDARPDSDDPASYALFLGTFESWLQQYVPQSSSSVDASEAAVLDLIAQARPQAVVSDEAFAAWFAVFERYFRMFVPQSSSSLDATEGAILDRIRAQRPTAAGESAYAGWFALYGAYFDMFVPQASSSLDGTESALLESLRLATPESSSVAGYAVWLDKLTEHFARTGSTVDATELANLHGLVAARPCVADSAAAVAERDTAAAAISANVDVFSELATASACEF